MERSVLERWEDPDCMEVFYDSFQRKLLIKRREVLQTLQIDFMITGDAWAIPGFDESIIAFSCDGRTLVHPTQEFLFLPSLKHQIVQAGSQRQILGFHWLPAGLPCDFVFIHTAGIDFYKLSPEELKLRNEKYCKARLSHYYLEPVSGTILAASVVTPNPMMAFFLKEDLRDVAGEEFRPQEGMETVAWTSPQINAHSLLKYDYKRDEETYRGALVRVYGHVLFAYLDFGTGKVTFRDISPTAIIKLDLLLTVPTGTGEIRAIDNVLVVHNFCLQYSFMFDLKGSEPQDPICISSHQENKDCVMRQMTMKAFTSSINVIDLCTAETNVSSPFPLSMKMLSVDQDVIVDISEGTLYLLGLRIQAISKQLLDPQENIKFLLRRGNCFPLAITVIAKALPVLLNLSALSDLFSILIAYIKANPDPKIDLQTEVIQGIFMVKCTGEDKEQVDYFLSVMLEYQRLLLEAEQEVPLDLEMKLLDWLVAGNRLDVLKKLLDRDVFSDTKETAATLISLFVKFDDKYYLTACLDMMWRLGQYEAISEILTPIDLHFESSNCLSNASFLYLPDADPVFIFPIN